MFKKPFAIFLLALLVLATCSAEASYTEQVAGKLGRGFGNVCYSAAEIPLQITNEMESDDYVYALPKGGLKGLVYGIGRLVVGAYEVATCIIPQNPIIPDFNQA